MDALTTLTHAAHRGATAYKAADKAVSGAQKITPLQDNTPPTAGSFFGALLDIVNPLQHIPIVSNIYQAATGDIPSAASNVIGGGLFGGIIGAAASLASEAFHAATGDTVAGTVQKAGEAIAGAGDVKKPIGTPLVADAHAVVDAATAVSNEAPESAPVIAAAAAAPGSLEPYKDRTMNLTKAGMDKHLDSDLEKVALAM